MKNRDEFIVLALEVFLWKELFPWNIWASARISAYIWSGWRFIGKSCASLGMPRHICMELMPVNLVSMLVEQSLRFCTWGTFWQVDYTSWLGKESRIFTSWTVVKDYVLISYTTCDSIGVVFHQVPAKLTSPRFPRVPHRPVPDSGSRYKLQLTCIALYYSNWPSPSMYTCCCHE